MLKRFSIISACLILSIIFSNYYIPKSNLIPTMTVPVTNKVIVLDAGHGSPDEGD